MVLRTGLLAHHRPGPLTRPKPSIAGIETVFVVDSTGRYVIDSSGNYVVTVAGSQTVPDGVLPPETPFAPSDISGLIFWNEPRLMTAADNDPIASVTDYSGGARHGVASSTSRPLFKTNILFGYDHDSPTLVGRPVLRFDGTDDFFTITGLDLSATPSAWVFMVVGNVTAGSIYNLFETSTNYASNNGAIRLNREAANTVRSGVFKTGASTNGAMFVTSTGPTLTTAFRAVDAIYDTTEPATVSGKEEGQTTVWVNNGEKIGSGSNSSPVLSGNLGNHTAYVASRAGTSLFAPMDLAMLCVYSRRPTHLERGKLAMYARDTYDLFS